MTDRIVLRKIFAVDSNTGLFLSSGQVLVTDGLGGTNWTNVITTLSTYGGPVVGNLPSTLSSSSNIVSQNTVSISSISSAFWYSVSSLGNIIDNKFPGGLTGQQLFSTVGGLGTIGYVSSSQLMSTVAGFGSAGYVSSAALVSTTQGLADAGNSSNLGTLGYISTASLRSTVAGLSQVGYISTGHLVSTTEGLNTTGSNVTQANLLSTVAGLGSVFYISTPQLVSTIGGLGRLQYVSTSQLTSSLAGLGTFQYVSVLSLVSTATGLGSLNYVSTASLVSTTFALSTLRTNIRFDNITTCIVTNSSNTFTNVGQVIYTSTFFNSSLGYTGVPTNVQIVAQLSNTHDMIFSTATISMAPFSNFINQSSIVTVDFYPTYAFTKLATGATAPALICMSSFLTYNGSNIQSSVTESFLYASRTQVTLENSNIIDDSNIFSQPIRIVIPQNTVNCNTSGTYYLTHRLVSSVNQGSFQNALHCNLVTPMFGSRGSIFVSIQNSI